MIQTPLRIGLSAIDEERFGIRTARASDISLDLLPNVTDFCRTNQVKLLIARCPVNELSAAQAMEQQGFILMDTLLYFSRSLLSRPIPSPDESVAIRPVRFEEADQIRDLTASVFQGYQGHYHADSRLDRQQSDEVYTSWAYNSCISRELADEVLVVEQQGRITGFITLKVSNPDTGEGPLYGVNPSFQGQGIGRNLVIGALKWFEARGLQKMVMSTQITNIASQKIWIRLGFEPLQAYYTFHKWFD